jgi:5S rRNA maturation endonuclease (ribonuclease M5)
MLLNRYGKINVLNKFIIIEGTIDIKQLNQLFSEALFKLFIACNGELK